MDSKNDLCIADDMSAFSAITLSTDIGDIVININNGNVEYPDDSPTAAKKFWIALEEAFVLRNVGGTCRDCRFCHSADAPGSYGYICGAPYVTDKYLYDSSEIRIKDLAFGCAMWKAREET